MHQSLSDVIAELVEEHRSTDREPEMFWSPYEGRYWKIRSCVFAEHHARKATFPDRLGWYIPASGGRVWAHVASNGTRQIKWHCDSCPFVSAAIRYFELEEYYGVNPRTVDVFSSRMDTTIVCEVTTCDRTDVELHHWAPSGVFGWIGTDDGSDMWPTSYLCRYHHHAWHDAMVGYTWRGVA